MATDPKPTTWQALRNLFAAKGLSGEDARVFYWMLSVVLVVMYAWIVIYTPAVRVPERLIPFTLLMLVHGGLHWTSLSLKPTSRGLWPYFAVQAALAFVITLLAGNQGISLGLFLALAGEAVGVFEDLRRSIFVVAGCLALSALGFVLVSGWEAVPFWLTLSIPAAVFVAVYVTALMRQAQARERAQALLRELEIAHRELAEYAARVEDLTLAAERARMARELHDTLAQGVAGLILQLEAIDSHLAHGRADKAQAVAQQAMARARATLADARRAIDDLRGGGAEAGDLAAAVSEEAARFTATTGIPCALDLAPPAELQGGLRAHAVRAVAEGLMNIARHAQARQAWVRVASREGQLEIVLRDDGVGFDPAAEAEAGHYGLLGLRERTRLAGGTLAVTSTPGEGTILTLRLPIMSKAEVESQGSAGH